jgi:uncharacterized protein (TIGR00251 family)
MTRKKEALPGLTLEVLVQPKSSRDEIVGFQDGRLRIRITAPPEGGKANEHLRAFLAKKMGISKSQVEIVYGEKSRNKRIHLHCPPEGIIEALQG